MSIIEQKLRHIQPQKVTFNSIWICCPFHENDDTPSCKINTKQKGKFPEGSFYCFGCGEKGNWKKLAQQLGIESDLGKKTIVIPEIHKSEFIRKKRLVYRNKKEIIEEDWRGIDKALLNHMGCYYVTPAKVKFLVLPVVMEGQVVNNIQARLKKHKKFTSYLMEEEATDGSKVLLFPMNIVKEMLKTGKNYNGKKIRSKGVCLVEGPRDALRLIQCGIPALAILGTHTWCEHKARLLKILCVLHKAFIIAMMDGDKAGKEAQKKVLATLKEMGIPHKKVNLIKWAKHYNMDKLDPMDAPDELIKMIKELSLSK